MLHDPSKELPLSPVDEAINAIVDLLERTWVGRPPADRYQHCLATACYEVVAHRSKASDLRYDKFRIRQAMDAVAGDLGFLRVEAWNDMPGRTKPEVMEFMEAVRQQVIKWRG